MIGTIIRSENHLYRLLQKSTNGIPLVGNLYRNISCILEAIAFPLKKGEVGIFIKEGFNPFGRNRGVDINLILESHLESFKKTINGHHYSFYKFGNSQCDNIFFNFVVALDNDFQTQYKTFIEKNKKLTNHIFGNYIDESSPIGKIMYCLTDGNPNFFGWAVKMFCRDNCSLYSIRHLMMFNEECGGLVKDLTKGNIIALSTRNDILAAIQELFYIRAKAQAKKTVSWFNPTQKKLLNSVLDQKENILILNGFSQLSKSKRINFIRKVSTIEDASEILKMMSFLCHHTTFSWNRESLLDFIKNTEGLDCEIVLNENNIVVVRVNDFETIKRLAKTTNWCISKNKSYWTQYVQDKIAPNQLMQMGPRIEIEPQPNHGLEEALLIEPWDLKFINKDEDTMFKDLIIKDNQEWSNNKNIYQYVIFDFNQKEDGKHSIVGVTVNTTHGITNAHDFNNKSMMEEVHLEHDLLDDDIPVIRHNNSLRRWFTFEDSVPSPSTDGTIQSFLSERGINESSLTKYKYEKMEWNRESFFEYIKNFLCEDEYDILYDANNKVLIKSNNVKMACILPNVNNIKRCRDFFQKRNGYIIWLFDFNLDKNNKAKTVFWLIDKIKSGYECSTSAFDETGFKNTEIYTSFDSMLMELDLPYDIINRPNNALAKMEKFMNIQEWPIAIDILHKNIDCSLTVDIQNKIVTVLCNSIYRYSSLDFYNKLKETNLPFSKLLGHYGLIEVIDFLARRVFPYSDNDIETLMPSSEYKIEELDVFFSKITKKIETEMPRFINRDQSIRYMRSFEEKINKVVLKCVLQDIINHIEKEGLTSLFPKILVRLIDAGARSTLIEDRQSSNYFERLLTYCLERSEKLEIGDINSASILVCNHTMEKIAIRLIKKICSSNTLKPKHISWMVENIKFWADRYGCTGSTIHLNLVNAVLEEGLIAHAISTNTAQDIRKSISTQESSSF